MELNNQKGKGWKERHGKARKLEGKIISQESKGEEGLVRKEKECKKKGYEGKEKDKGRMDIGKEIKIKPRNKEEESKGNVERLKKNKGDVWST